MKGLRAPSVASFGVTLLLVGLVACGRGPSKGSGDETSEPLLAEVDHRYRQLLRQEMVQVEHTARRLASHLARGEADLAASAAASIRDTLVLARSLSASQRQELRRQLPADFLEHEESFQRTAGALSAAAASGDLEQAATLYGRLLERCLACHSRYASGRFPGFARHLGAGRSLPGASSSSSPAGSGN